MPVKSLKDSRRGVGFGGARGGGESDNSDQDAGDESKVRGRDEGKRQRAVGEGMGGLGEKGKRMHASRSLSPEREDEGQYRIVEVEEDYLHIGCIYDRDAIALGRRQEQRALDKGTPWLGSFDIDSMQGGEDAVALERGAAHKVPWWQEQDLPSKEVDAKRQRLVQKQFETNVFKRAGVLGLSTSRNPVP